MICVCVPLPVCGGMFVREVNSFLTRCSDGILRSECYVAKLDLSPLGLQDAVNDASGVQAAFTAKAALIRGSFGPLQSALSDRDHPCCL